jgi:LysR family hydrogen peroxide-inducible transcriptional activator
MNLRDLEYLIALETYRHFGKAADACFVSQPALSMQIKKLENYLGLKLLERTNKSVLLTPSGHLMVERAKRILESVDEMRQMAKLAKDPYSGELKLGIIPTLAPYLLPHIIPSFTKEFPNLSLYLIEEQTILLIEKLKTGKLDAALLAYPIFQEKFTQTVLFEEEFFLALPKTHPLAKRKTIKSEELINKNILLLQEGHCMREPTLALCQKLRATEMQGFQATSLETLRHMVTANIGFTLMPRLAHQINDGLAYLPFSSQKPSRTIGLFWRASSTRKVALNKLAIYIKKCLANKKLVRITE